MGGRGGRSHGGGSRTAPQSSRYDAVERLARQMGIYLNVGSLQRGNINPIYQLCSQPCGRIDADSVRRKQRLDLVKRGPDCILINLRQALFV